MELFIILITIFFCCAAFGLYKIIKTKDYGIGSLSFIMAIVSFVFAIVISPIELTNSNLKEKTNIDKEEDIAEKEEDIAEKEEDTTEIKDEKIDTSDGEKKPSQNSIDIKKKRDELILKAKKEFELSGYEKSIEILSEGLKILPDDKVIIDEINRYKEYRPKNLVDMEWISNNATGTNQHTYKNKYLEDCYGNSYKTSFSLSRGEVIYNLDYKYTELKGIIATIKGREADEYHDSAILSIYCDESLVYTSSNYNNKTEPSTISINLTGVKKLSLRWECKGGNIWKNWGDFATLFNATVYK